MSEFLDRLATSTLTLGGVKCASVSIKPRPGRDRSTGTWHLQCAYSDWPALHAWFQGGPRTTTPEGGGELRQALSRLGHTFTTTGDTETLAAALSEWGTAALPKLDGMFAFSWTKGSTRIIARDHFGKVPLYAVRTRAGFRWSSERKGLGPHSAHASPVPPGSYLDVTTGKLHRYYTLPAVSDNSPGDLLRLLDDGVRKRLLADAPLCVLISGGLDSSAILTLAKKHKPDVVAYTATLDPKSSDLIAARRLCRDLSVELREVHVPQPTHADIAAAINANEIPSKAQTEIALLCLPLAKQIAADGFKACLSGEAADELFGGYGNMMIKAASLGYRVEAKVLDASWLGVAQSRCRTIFVGVRDDLGLAPAFPKPFPHRYTIRDALPHITSCIHDTKGQFGVGECIDRPCPTITHAGGAASGHFTVVERETYLADSAIGREWDRMGKPGTQSEKYFQLVRPDLDKPCPTITATAGLTGAAGVCHPIERRKFSIAEVKALSGVPHDFVLTGTFRQMWERMGRIHSPVAVKAIASAIRDEILMRIK